MKPQTEWIYLKISDQLNICVLIQCTEDTPMELKEKAALLVYKKMQLFNVVKVAA